MVGNLQIIGFTDDTNNMMGELVLTFISLCNIFRKYSVYETAECKLTLKQL